MNETVSQQIKLCTQTEVIRRDHVDNREHESGAQPAVTVFERGGELELCLVLRTHLHRHKQTATHAKKYAKSRRRHRRGFRIIREKVMRGELEF